MSQFISFTTEYRYDDGKKYRVSAEQRLNDWLKENDVEIISWKPCQLDGPYDNFYKRFESALCIVVEYRRKETAYNEIKGVFS